MAALLWAGLFVSAPVVQADAIGRTSEILGFLVIEGELLTGESDAGTVHAIDVLLEASASAGLATDFVLEHATVPSPGLLGEEDPRSLTIWNRFDPSNIDVVRSDNGRGLAFTMRTEAGLFLDFSIESDEGPIATGIYADEETWFRLNSFETSADGAIAFDLEFSIPFEGAIQSGRLRRNAAAGEVNPAFLQLTESELLDARPGGIDRYWIQLGEGAAATPLYFGEQFAETPVLSPEEALRLVASDRAKIESGESGRSVRDEGPRPKSRAADQEKNAAQSKPVVSSDVRLRATGAESAPPVARQSPSAAGGVALGAGQAAPQASDESGNAMIEGADRRERFKTAVPGSNRAELPVADSWIDFSEHRAPKSTASRNFSDDRSEGAVEKADYARRREEKTSSAIQQIDSLAVDATDALTVRAFSGDDGGASRHRPPSDASSSDSSTSAQLRALPNEKSWLSETIGETLARSLDLAVDRLRSLMRRGLEWWQEVGS